MQYNLLTIKSVTGNTGSNVTSQLFKLAFTDGKELTVPRPVLQGIASAVYGAREANWTRTELHYNDRVFVLPNPVEFDSMTTLRPLFKWALDSGMEFMSKVSTRDYSKKEHFFRAHVQRLPEVIDGYKTVVTETCFDKDNMQLSLDIEQHFMNNNLIDECNNFAHSVENVTRLPPPKRTVDVVTLPPVTIHRRYAAHM